MSPMEEKIRLARKRSFVVLGIIGAALYWFTQTSPDDLYASRISEATEKVSVTEKKVQETEDQFNNKAKFREEMERVSQTFRLALDYLPKDMNTQDLLKSIYLEARTAGVELSNFKPKDPVPKDFYDELPMDISLKGNYSQLITFLASVSKLPRIVNIRDIEITNPVFVDGTPVMELSGTLVGYRYKESSP